MNNGKNYDILCIPGLQVQWRNNQNTIKHFLKQQHYKNIILMGGGCNRDFYASINSAEGGPSKKNNLSGGFKLTEEGFGRVKQAMEDDGRVREVVNDCKYKHNKMVVDYRSMINRVGKNQKNRHLKHLKNIFSGIEYDNLFITSVIPWVIDDPSFRYVKEFFNSGLKLDLEKGRLIINNKKVGFIDLHTVYEKPQRLLRECI